MRSRSFLLQCALLMLLTFGTPFALAQTQRNFSGKLDGRLHSDAEMASSLSIWDEAKPDVASALGLLLRNGDHLFNGKLTLQADPLMRFEGSIIRSTDGTDVLYVDLDKDGKFGDNEKYAFQPLGPSEPDKRLKDQTAFAISFSSGLYKSFSIQVRLPKPDVPTPAGPNQIAVIYTGQPLVEGYVQLPNRKLLMRFEYNLLQNSVDLGKAVEWADVNGDGQIDTTPGSPERLKARGTAPSFRVGKLTLSVQSVDLATNTFVLRSVPKGDFHGFDLKVGSKLPNFSFIDFNGETRYLSQIRAKYLLLDFWATWCRPCLLDLPFQKKAYEEFHSRGFEILGMDGDDTLEKPKKLLSEKQIAWPQARRDKELFEDKFQISEWPTMLLIDAKGKIISMGNAQHFPLDGDNLSKSLQTLFQDHR